MSCSKCNSQNTNCGCSDAALTTNPNTLQSTLCPTPTPCSEYVNAKCVYINDGIFDAALPPLTTLEQVIQQLILMITNPECTQTDSCNCPGGGTTYTVNNGLTENPLGNFQLGGTLIQSTTILTQGNSFLIERTTNGETLQIVNSSTSSGTSQTALRARSTDGLAGDFSAGDNFYRIDAIQPIIKVTRTTTLPPDPSTNYDEIGASIDYLMPTVNGMISTPITWANRLASRWEQSLNNGTTSPTSRFELYGRDGGSAQRHLAVRGSGEVILDSYGSGTFLGLPTYMLGVNVNGNVIEKLLLSNLPAPKVLLKTQNIVKGYDGINGILDNTEVIDQFQLTRSPIVTVMDIPQEVIDYYPIYLEMVIHKPNRKGKSFIVPPPYLYDPGTDTGSNPLETELTVPLKTRGGLSKVIDNPLLPPPLVYNPLRVSRPNHYKVTTMGQNIPVYEYLSGRFTLINQFYNDAFFGPTQTQLPIPYYNIGPNRNSLSCLQGYSSNFKPLYIAFRYVAWDVTANGGLGEFISGPLSETIAVSSKIFPFIVKTKGSRTYPAGAVPATLNLHQLFDPTELSCWFVHRR